MAEIFESIDTFKNQAECDKWHGKVIKYEQIKKLPSRNAFLESEIYVDTNEKITKGSELFFMPNDLQEMHLQEKKYEKALYKVVLFGVLIDGRKSCVVINGIRPYFEAVIPCTPTECGETSVQCENDEQDDESARALLLYQQLQQMKYACPISFEVLKGRQFKTYQKDRRTFARFYFEKLKTRKEAINFVRSKGFETTSDDTSCYYRVACRDYLTTMSSWVTISNYKIRTYSGIREPVFDVHIDDYKKYVGNIMDNPRLTKDNTMTCGWDIETFSADGDLPRPENPEHCVFMISMTFQWHHATDQLLRVCLVDLPCKPRPNYLTIVCGSEKKLIKAFGKIIFKMKPEINLGFNDADYDWPWVVNRGKSYTGVLAFLAESFDNARHWKNYDDSDVFQYNFKKERVKLEADTSADGSSLVFPGYINIDVRTIFRQLYPTEEKSNLNFYLNLNELDVKKDMPYQEMFRIYKELLALMKRRNAIEEIINGCGSRALGKRSGLRRELGQTNVVRNISDIVLEYTSGVEYERLTDLMGEVADYCVIDSQRCHELMKNRSVIMDRREVANLSYTTMFDALYRANGMKVRNLVIARGQNRGLKFSNISNDGVMAEGKYPGAYVFPPKKGLVTSKLTMYERTEHAKLIPKYAEWFEVSPDELRQYTEIIEIHGCHMTEENLSSLLRELQGEPLRKCFIDFLLEPTKRPITGLDFSSLYPSLIMTYNLSPEYIITNKKEAQEAQADGHTLHKIKFTFNDRVVRGWSIRHDNKLDPDDPECKFGIYPMILKELFDMRKLLKKDLHIWEEKKEKMETLDKEEFDKPENKKAYDSVCFNFNYINSKQKALKVFMNTFYGETGNKRSPFFVIQLAGAITTSGQDNIKMVQQYVEKRGCNVYYGDQSGPSGLEILNRLLVLACFK
jgi:DNA polymerase elongation subunit (family B)